MTVATRSKEERTGAPKSHILIVEDDAAVTKLVTEYLQHEGLLGTSVTTVADMRTSVGAQQVDLILLDVGLPDEDGWSALRWLRQNTSIPVVMLTGKGETVDKVIGLEMGADDYIAKPFDLRELLARVRSVLRRTENKTTESNAEGLLRFGDWTLDLASQQLSDRDGEPVHLTQAEYRIIVALAQNPRKVITRDQLMDVMTGRDWEPYDRSVDVHISNLRRKLDGSGKFPNLIRTVRGSGYMLIPPRK